MAPPWKFLARLISPGREQKRENGSTDEVTPDPLAFAGPTEPLAEESLDSPDRPASKEVHLLDQAPAVFAEPVHTEEAESDGHDDAHRVDTKIVGAADPASSDGLLTDVTAAPIATKSKRAAGVTPRKQRRRVKKAIVISHVSHADEMSLDEEIKVLRGQLAGKLKLQNAQLREKLMRFDR